MQMLSGMPQANHMQRSSILTVLSGVLATPYQHKATAALCDLLEQSIQHSREQQQKKKNVPGLTGDEAARLLKNAVYTRGVASSYTLEALERLCGMPCIREAADAMTITAQLPRILQRKP